MLLDYIDKVDRHFATGTPGSLISMEIEGRITASFMHSWARKKCAAT
ncbi:MAG: hypothetical protein HFG19_09450 [Oscillospiraceae bacterium]|nr:hypothetical protein [Oscillospiraceae bacterium]